MITKNIGIHSKPSSAIRIFERIIEPILTYNCEIALAYLPKTWDFNKFKEKIWEQGKEISKVVTSFLRQILGVHKKTTNSAILAETGKYPIIITVYTYIFKYWLQLEKSENKLLKEAHKINIENHQNGKTSWIKIIDFLLKFTDTNVPQDKTEKVITLNFRKRMKTLFEKWWEAQAIITGQNKLDFYYRYKRTYRYEEYLDNIHRNIRMPITRLRLSCHCLPIETLRYKNIERNERKCQICKLDERGDEEHYLKTCTNNNITHCRTHFVKTIKNIPQFIEFSDNNIIEYAMNMKDQLIQKPTAIYIQKLFKAYK